jgi:hypothetical protein
MLKVSPASLHTFIDTPNCVLEHPNSNYVITVGDWNFKILYLCVFFVL